MVKVLSLFSGSLASRVATRLVETHPDVESVCLLHFRSPFAREPEGLRQLVRQEWPGVPLRTQSLKREYRRLIVSDGFEGFDLRRSCLNCRSLLLSRASRYMERVGAEYLVTGDVLGENGVERKDLCAISDACGLTGKILRPLCSEEPERPKGGISAWAGKGAWRRRRADMSGLLVTLAEHLDLEMVDPLTCRNRCKLTLPGFGDRVAHLFNDVSFTLNELRLLDFPWYYEVHPDTKIVVAIEDEEKRELQNLFLPQDLRVYPAAPHGPMTLVRTPSRTAAPHEGDRIIELAARITSTHLDVDTTCAIPVYYRFEDENERHLVNVMPFESHDEIAQLKMVDVVPLERLRVAVG